MYDGKERRGKRREKREVREEEHTVIHEQCSSPFLLWPLFQPSPLLHWPSLLFVCSSLCSLRLVFLCPRCWLYFQLCPSTGIMIELEGKEMRRGEKIPACMGLLLVVTREKSCVVDYEFPKWKFIV